MFGSPADDVTHWGVYRLDARGKVDGSLLTFGAAGGVVVNRWPLEELSTAEVRNRWGGGRYRLHWFASEGPNGTSRGQGHPFELTVDEPEPAPAASATDPLAQYMAIQRASEERAARELERALELARSLGGAVGPVARTVTAPEVEELTRLRRENEDLRQRAMVREEGDRIRESMRADLERRDDRIAELERESRAEDAAPRFEPGSPIVETLVFAALNAAAKNPGLIASVVGPIVERVMASKGAPAPAPATVSSPPPPPAPTAAPRLAVVPFPRPAPAAPAPAASAALPDEYGPPTPIEKPSTTDTDKAGE